jgi:HAD superfamily hydrolase (TIGR01459 family)
MIPSNDRLIGYGLPRTLLVVILSILFRNVCGFVILVPSSVNHHTVRSPSFLWRTALAGYPEAIPELDSSGASSLSIAMRLVSGLKHTVDHYDVFLLDMWGVLHDGSRPYDGVLEAIQELKRRGKTLMILSNSSKRYDNSVQNLQKLGFQTSDFAKIITSGEVTHQLLLDSVSSSWAPLQSISKSKRVLIFGSGDEDVPYCVSCGWTPVYDVEHADLLLARGPFTLPTRKGGVLDRRIDGEIEYQTALMDILQTSAQRQIPMIVSNPDKVRPDQDRSPMPGQIGDAYELIFKQQHSISATSPPVKRVGKPFPDVYDVALQDMACDMARVCMVGDALETDAVGGTLVGIDTIWVVNNGVHSMDVQSLYPGDLLAASNHVLEMFNTNTTGTYAEGLILKPAVVMPCFQW